VTVKRVIYCSRAVVDFDPEALIGLLRTARQRNERAGISGMLLYCRQSFLQMLEGDALALDETFDRIKADPRHTRIRELQNTEISRRMFADWSMGFEHVSDDDLATHLDGYTPATSYPMLNPDFIVDAAIAETLLGLYTTARHTTS
jgi:hypothetical protein